MKIPCILFAAALLLCPAVAQETAHPFEKEIQAFEASDRTNPPPKRSILFVGSSSIRMWRTLAADLPEYRVINRGFGGSQISNAIHFAERIVIPYRPPVIVMYSGGNDLNAGKSAETVFNDYKLFVNKVRAKLPETKIAYISIAPNPARWKQMDRIREANRLIREFAQKDPSLSFIDMHPHMLGADGNPKPDIYLDDKLHMNANGYAIWKQVVGEHLKALPAAQTARR